MEQKRDSELINMIAQVCDSPGQFVKTVMNLRGMTSRKFAKKINTSRAYIDMIVTNHSPIGIKACIKLAKALDIDPLVLGRLASDYNIKKILGDATGGN